MKQPAIEQLKEAIEDMEDTVNRIGMGEMTFSEAGDYIHTNGGDVAIRAMKKALEELRECKK